MNTETDPTPKIPLFIWATITASFLHYGENIEKVIEVNEVIEMKEDLIKEVKRYIVLLYGEIEYKGHKYDVRKVNYKVIIKSFNRI